LIPIAIFGLGGYALFSLIHPRLEARTRVQTEHDKTAAVLQTVKNLRQAAQDYLKDMRNQGTPLETGHVIDLTELSAHRSLPTPRSRVTLESFAYYVLPEDAPADVMEMEVTTDVLRVVLTRAGEGSLYKK
jgi:hypothetical protein